MRFLAFILASLFLAALPALAAEAPTMTGDTGTAALAVPSSDADQSPKQRWVIQMPQLVTPEAAQKASSLAVASNSVASPAPLPPEIIAPVTVVPEGVRYTIATVEDNTRAYNKIRAVLAETPHDFRSLMPVGGDVTSYTGIFMALHDLDGQRDKIRLLNTVTYKIPFNDLVTKEITGYGAKTAQQLEMLAAAYMEKIKISKDYKIRKLTPEEMAITWYSSARDIYEPAYVVEDGAHKYVFYMSHDGEYLEFFEDLGHPCFNEMGTGENYMPCKCVGTTQDGLKYTVIFQSCKAKE